MSTKADQMRANALHEVGEDYVWGAEGTGGVWGEDDYDCSGFVWRMYDNVGIHKQRTTADGFYHMSHIIPAPAHVGDMFVLLNSSGRATHIGLYIGKGLCVEARNPTVGVTKSTVLQVNARHPKWIARLADLGELTPTVTAPPPPPPPAPTGGTNWLVVPAALNMRTGPGTSYAIRMVLKHDQTVTQMGAVKNGWMPVKRYLVRGWVAAQYLRRK